MMCRVGSGDPDGSCSGPKKQNGGGARSKGERAISAESSRSDAISAEGTSDTCLRHSCVVERPA